MSKSIKLNNLICFNFYSGYRETEQLFRLIVGNEMTIQKSFILSFLLGTKKTMKETSEHLDLDSSAVSTLVDRMFKKGLIERERDLKDRRVVFIKLTKEGEILESDLQAKVSKFRQLLTEEISDVEQSKLVEIVSKIKCNHQKVIDENAAAA